MVDEALADVVDVEIQLHRDRDRPREELRRRDRAIGLALREIDAADRRALLGGWVRAVQKEEGDAGAGETFVRVTHALAWLLALFGLLSGAGAASAVLAYDGKHPVNVVHFLAVFVGLQLLLLLLFVSSSTLWRLRGRLPGASGLYGLVRLGFDGLAGLFDRRLSAERRASLRAARGGLRVSHVVYGDLERWLIVSLAQRFGLFFNLGALATCLYLISFSDLAFAWQTTLDVGAPEFHTLVRVIAAPWGWIYPDGVPTLDVVAASRYFRIGGSFAGHAATDAALLGQWWRFLVLALCVYGLLPRATLSLIAARKLRQAVSNLRFDHGEVASLLERLSSPLVETRAPTKEAASADRGAAPTAARPAPGRDAHAAVVVWGDIPLDDAAARALLERRFGWQVEKLARAGVDDTSADADAIDALVAPPTTGPLVLVAEAFEAPTREARGFVERLRAAAGAARPLVVALLGEDGVPPRAADLRIWQRHLAALGDPYLRVEALVEPA